MNIKPVPLFRHLSNIILAGIFLSFIAGHIPGHYLLDVTNHFRPFLIIIVIIMLIVRFKELKVAKTVVLILPIALLNFHMFSFPEFPKRHSSKEIKVIQMNLLMSNSNFHLVRDQIKKEKPDIISFQEYTPEWNRELKSVLKDYTLTKRVIDSPFGICVASKIPVSRSTVQYLKGQSIPHIELTLDIEGKEITFLSIHPTPPFSQELFESRNRFYEKLIKQYEKDSSMIIVGDLNCTQWSPYYQRVENQLRLKNSSPFFSNTWPDFLPISIFQLDHILISKQFQLINSKVLEGIGSDHYPIGATISIPVEEK